MRKRQRMRTIRETKANENNEKGETQETCIEIRSEKLKQKEEKRGNATRWKISE